MNTDPPLIVDIWRRQQPMAQMCETLTRSLFDLHVLSKPYFDRFGLILAFDGDSPVGFAHASFGPNQDRTDLDFKAGVISQIRVIDEVAGADVYQGLLEHASEYLKGKGAEEIYVGSRFPYAPFYMGIYGGSRLPGVLSIDEKCLAAYEDFGFAAYERVAVYFRHLADFRIPVDRQLMSLRRQYQVIAEADPLERSWWESCTLGLAERDCFRVTAKGGGDDVACANFWDIQPLASEWGVSARGIYDMLVSPEHRESGLGKYLLAEALKQLAQQHVGVVEAQVLASNINATNVFEALGFKVASEGILMKKSIS